MAVEESVAMLETGRPLQTLANLLERLGGVLLERVRFSPAPGTAAEQDVLRIAAHEGRACELVDGVLVEKPAVRTVRVFQSRTTSLTLGEEGTLSGGSIPAGFTLSLRERFAELDRHG
jgi:hypothetical protein